MSEKFQSTLPREERRRWITLLVHHLNFNPRSHERSDNTRTVVIVVLDISIHAPTRGATKKSVDDGDMMSISIHAPTRGATAILHKKFVYFYTIPTINI